MAAFVKVRLLASSFFQLGAQLKLTSVVCELCDNSRITQCVTHLLGIPPIFAQSRHHILCICSALTVHFYLPHTLQPLLCDSDSSETSLRWDVNV